MVAITSVLALVQCSSLADTQYEVVVEMDGVVYEVPVVKALPPELASNQEIVAPVLAVAPRATVPGPQLELGVVEATVGML